MKEGTERRVAIIAAAGWKAIGRNVGLQHIPGPFLPLGDGTTIVSRLAGQLGNLGFEVFIAIGALGYPFGSYQLRWGSDERGYNTPSEEGLRSIGLSPADSPWTTELYGQISQWGELVSIPDPGWGNQHDTFCVSLDRIGKQWDKVLLICGDTILDDSLIVGITNLLPWPCQFQMHPCHSIFLLDRKHVGVYRNHAQDYRRRPDKYQAWKRIIPRYPDGQIGTGLLERDGIKHYGWHNWPEGVIEDSNKMWVDVDSPSKYAQMAWVPMEVAIEKKNEVVPNKTLPVRTSESKAEICEEMEYTPPKRMKGKPSWYRWDGGWYEADGDRTRYCSWTLNEGSVVMDIGAYHGDWSKRMADRYGCTVYAFEPAPRAFGIAEEALRGYDKVHLYNFALGEGNKTFSLGDADRDGAGLHKNTPPIIKAKMRDIVEVFKEQHIEHVDLISVNIEGGEFYLFPYIISTGLVNIISRFMIQWHHVFNNAGNEMIGIQEELAKTHRMRWNHGTWETWERKETNG